MSFELTEVVDICCRGGEGPDKGVFRPHVQVRVGKVRHGVRVSSSRLKGNSEKIREALTASVTRIKGLATKSGHSGREFHFHFIPHKN